ncbi:MAG TPA: CcmD family protein [Ginsengibacter sp.]|nr:CcmD family protein [Ginsengibacter sp.]HRP16919.1 CcmD family protein [Ginsengibacter sp.]HRP44879.1 CcmD family protein [Ginsengibacter sp.]
MANRLMSRVSLFIIFILSTFSSLGQDSSAAPVSSMESHDKIYVVMTVCLVILLVFLLYLVRIDIKISKKEKEG